MTIEQAAIIGTSRYATWVLAQNHLLNCVEDHTDEEQHEFFVLHPVVCAGWAGWVHTAYHRERAKMRRQAQRQRGHLTRPQARRWKEIEAEFQWLFRVGVIWHPAIERNGTDCFGCHACGHVWSKYWWPWAHYND